MRARLIAATAVALAVCSPATAGGNGHGRNCPATTGRGAGVTIEEFCFTPHTISVAPGAIVTFVNHDDTDHAVTGQAPGWNQTLGYGGAVKFRFTKPGTYAYYCEFHPQMTGVVQVGSSTRAGLGSAVVFIWEGRDSSVPAMDEPAPAAPVVSPPVSAPVHASKPVWPWLAGTIPPAGAVGLVLFRRRHHAPKA